jgi:hypothetical protein
MASHTKSELRWAAGVLARAIRASTPAAVPVRQEVQATAGGTGTGGAPRVFDGLVEAA